MARMFRVQPIVVLLLLVLAVLAVLAGPARAAGPVLQPPTTIDGPSASIQKLSGLSVARDGTGGLVYLSAVGGVPHVFVSVLTAGAFGPPVQVDAALGAASSQPVIAAGDGGLLLIAFINGAHLYVVSRPDASAPPSAPQDLYGGALNPAIAVSIHSRGYLAFVAANGSGYDVRDAYYYAGQWQLNPASLNATPADDAGTLAGAPKVVAAGDGEGMVAWGEGGHIYARRIWFAHSSYAIEQADVPSMSGFAAVTADSPGVAAGDNSSYVDVTFREVFTNGSQTISRVLVNRLVGSVPQGAQETDGQSLANGPGATAPQIVMMADGVGFVTSQLQRANQVWATVLGQNGVVGAAQQIDSLANATPPLPTPAITSNGSGLIAWQHDPGLIGTPDIRARFYTSSSFGPEMVASNPAQGPANAAQGLFAAGDRAGDAAIAYVQGSGPSAMIEVSQLVAPPGSFSESRTPRYRTTATPVLSWFAPRELWGPLTYVVSIDGSAAGTASATSFTPSGPLSQGPHTFQVTAVNTHGLTSSASAATFFVDSISPLGQFTLTGPERKGAALHLRTRYSDTVAGVPPADASGIASVRVSWGDGTGDRIRRQAAAHRYARTGRYLLTLTLTDRAGNRTVLARRLRILAR